MGVEVLAFKVENGQPTPENFYAWLSQQRGGTQLRYPDDLPTELNKDLLEWFAAVSLKFPVLGGPLDTRDSDLSAEYICRPRVVYAKFTNRVGDAALEFSRVEAAKRGLGILGEGELLFPD